MIRGHLLNERYKIMSKIGAGGMADVYLARDIILERDVAIKALRLEYANDQEFIARFDREAQSATSLAHENIVSIYDVGEEDHLLYMVMEYVDGMTLKEYIQNYGPLDVQETLDIMKQIVSAIAHAHANNIVHRDIKPQNILMDRFGKVKVTDFGIAIALSATSLTQTNSILGSVHYLSPEQARGGMATKKSDIYALGIVMYEMLTGRLPFSGQSPVSIALKHLQSETPSVRKFNPDIPQSVENIVLKATAKDPFHRFESIYDLEEAVETALSPEKLNEEPYKPPKEVGEETKAIPIITDDHFQSTSNEETIIHHTSGTTKHFRDDGSNDLSKKEMNKKKRKKWPIILSVFLFLLVIGGLLLALPLLLQPKEVTIPNVIEMEANKAIDELETLNLQVEKEEVSSDEIEEGFVTRVSPSVGRKVNEGSTVILFVSTGKEKVEFKDYVGRDFNQVKRELEIAGFEDFTSYEEYSDRPIGEIIAQIYPEPGSEVVPSETNVRFEISKGPEPIKLSNLIGKTEQEAKSILEEHNLRMEKYERNSETVEPGIVMEQEPESGAEITPGSSVEIYVSIGPKPKPPKTITITVPVEYSTSDADQSEDENNMAEEKIVRIYVDDMENDISNIYEEKTITRNEDITFSVTVAPGDSATYKVMLNDQVIEENEISYEDGE